MTEFDRYVVTSCLLAVIVLCASPILFLLWRQKFRRTNRKLKLKLSGSATSIALISLFIAPVILPLAPIALFTSLEGEELLLILIGFFFVFLATFCVLVPLFPSTPWEHTDDGIPRSRAALNSKRTGSFLMGLLVLFIASESIRDFVQPRLFIEGRVDRAWTEMGKYREHPHVQIDGQTHRATRAAYALATAGSRVRAEVGAGSDRIYRLQHLTTSPLLWLDSPLLRLDLPR